MKRSKPKRKALDWKLIWDLFDEWCHKYEDGKRVKCPTCKSIPLSISPDWEEQQAAIQRIVEAHR